MQAAAAALIAARWALPFEMLSSPAHLGPGAALGAQAANRWRIHDDSWPWRTFFNSIIP